MNPMENDADTVTTIENFVAFELPLPSSFATRTLIFQPNIRNIDTLVLIHNILDRFHVVHRKYPLHLYWIYFMIHIRYYKI